MYNNFITQFAGAFATTSQTLLSYDVGLILITTIQNGIMVGLFVGLLTRATWWVWK